MRRLSDGRLELKLSYPGNGYFLETHWTQDKNPVTMWIERAYAADPDDDELEVGERTRARARAREGRVASASRNTSPSETPPPPVPFLAARRAR